MRRMPLFSVLVALALLGGAGGCSGDDAGATPSSATGASLPTSGAPGMTSTTGTESGPQGSPSETAGNTTGIPGTSGDDSTSPDAETSSIREISFGAPGSTSAPSGRGSFSFGVASAATQIEDQNPNVDWYVWSAPEPEGLGEGTFIDRASEGFSRAIADVALLEVLGVDIYRFSVEWARIEPERGVISEEGLQHYDDFIDALVAAGIRPMITIHHFSNPIWVDDPRDPDCEEGPTDANLCGWDHPEGGPLVVEAIGAHAARLAARYGDRVDEWVTVNEPINYMLAAYGVGYFPPGKGLILTRFERFAGAVRNYLAAHAAMYDAIKENDVVDATGDGLAASVGYTLSVAEWVPARQNRPSEDRIDTEAVARVNAVYHHLFTESILRGAFDPNLDGTFPEEQPDWEGKLDWLGVQYYFRAGVTGRPALIPRVRATVCYADFNLGSCLPPEDPTHYVPEMGYEFWAPGLYNRLVEFSERWPDLPMTVTESGLSTNVGARRAEHIVRSLEQIQRAIEDGADVRGYYHWTLTDNFEWAEGYGPRFGLYSVDFGGTWDRTRTEGAEVLAEIIGARGVSIAQREALGGLGPMTPEEMEE